MPIGSQAVLKQTQNKMTFGRLHVQRAALISSLCAALASSKTHNFGKSVGVSQEQTGIDKQQRWIQTLRSAHTNLQSHQVIGHCVGQAVWQPALAGCISTFGSCRVLAEPVAGPTGGACSRGGTAFTGLLCCLASFSACCLKSV